MRKLGNMFFSKKVQVKLNLLENFKIKNLWNKDKDWLLQKKQTYYILYRLFWKKLLKLEKYWVDLSKTKNAYAIYNFGP